MRACGQVLSNLARRLDPVERRHRDVHQHHVRLERAGELDRLLPVAGGPDDLDAVVVCEQRLDRLDEQRLVVGNEHANARASGVRCGFHS